MLKAPSNAVVLIVSATRDVVICDSTLAIRLMYVIEAATETAWGTIVSTAKVRNLISAIAPKQTSLVALHMSAFGDKADMSLCAAHVSF